MAEAEAQRRPGRADGSGARRVLIACALLFVATLIVYMPLRDAQLTLDSVPIAGQDPRVLHGDAGALILGDWWNLQSDETHAASGPSLWRPLSKLWLCWLHPRDGQPRGSADALPLIMLGNVLLAAVLAVLRFRLLLHLLQPARGAMTAALIAALALALHPVHVEVVGSAVGAADLLATVLLTAALLVQVTGSGWRSAVAQALLVFLALSAKESTVVAPVWAAVLALLAGSGWKSSLRAALPAGAAVLAYLLLRSAVLGETLGVGDPVFALFSTTERVGTALAAIATYDLQALLLPLWLHPNITLLDLAPAAGLTDVRAIAGAVILTGLVVVCVLLWRRGARLAAAGLLLLLTGMAPVSNLGFSIGAIAASRFLVLPLLGWGMVLAAVVLWLQQHSGRWLWSAGVIGCCVLLPLVATVRELPRWHSDEDLFRSMTVRHPECAFGWYNLGVHEQMRGHAAQAVECFEAAAAKPLPRLASCGLIQEDLLESAFQARMNAAGMALQSGSPQGVARSAAHYRAAQELCSEGQRTAAVHGSATRWGNLLAEALCGESRTVAMRTPRGGATAATAAMMARAAAAGPDSLSVPALRAWLAEVDGDPGAALLEFARAAQNVRARWSHEAAARAHSREHAALLERLGRKSEAAELRLGVALAGQNAEPPQALLQAALSAPADAGGTTRELQRAALTAWKERGAVGSREERAAAESLLSRLR